jgi:hypothetical protein
MSRVNRTAAMISALVAGFSGLAGVGNINPTPPRVRSRCTNKFTPHQGERECARRRKQMAAQRKAV